MEEATFFSADPLLFVIVLSWNRPADTLDCISAVFRSEYKNIQIVVVDNASEHKAVARISSAYPELTLIQNQTNLGYTGGNNVGIQYALKHGAEYVVLLNNDVLVEIDTFSKLVLAAESDPKIAAAGCKVRVFEDPTRLWAAGNVFPRGDTLPIDDGSFDTPREINYAVGCCILLRRSALENVGLLDEDYFAVHGERDWCYRARDHGYQILYVPDAVVEHKTSVSFTSNYSPAYHYLFVRNQLRFWEQQRAIPADWRRIHNIILVWREEVNLIFRTGNGKLRRMWEATRGIIDYMRGRFGAPPNIN